MLLSVSELKSSKDTLCGISKGIGSYSVAHAEIIIKPHLTSTKSGAAVVSRS